MRLVGRAFGLVRLPLHLSHDTGDTHHMPRLLQLTLDVEVEMKPGETSAAAGDRVTRHVRKLNGLVDVTIENETVFQFGKDDS